MPIIANLKEISFDLKMSFEDLEKTKIEKYIENKIDYININNTLDMYYYVQDIFGKNSHIDIGNCKFNEKFLYQYFSIDNENEQLHKNLILVKRKIREEDSYTFLEYDPNIPETDVFEYCDVTKDDIIDIIRSKSLIPGLIIKDNGEIIEQNLLFLNRNDDVGKIVLETNNKEIFYLNIANIVNKHNNNDNLVNEIMKEKANAYGTNYFYTQICNGPLIFNCFYLSHSETKNEIVSNLINDDIYGDVIIFIQNNCDNDTDTIIDASKDLFNKIYDVIVNQKKIKRKNPHFFNIYKELEICEK